MANSSLSAHGEEPGDHSLFMWFVSAMVLATSISVNIIWKLLMKCYYQFVITKRDANHAHTASDSGCMVEKRHASTQTTEHYGSNHGVGPVYVTKCGERWHNARCGHIYGRQTKMLTPCSDCTEG